MPLPKGFKHSEETKRKISKAVKGNKHPNYKHGLSINQELSGRDLIREQIRIRDNHTCQKCGKEWQEGMRRLDVHHKDCKKEKTRQYENYKKEQYNMTTLCHKCHINLPEHRKAISDGRKNKNSLSTDNKKITDFRLYLTT